MDVNNNVLPGRSKLLVLLSFLANKLRSWLIFSFKYPWIKISKKGSFIRMPFSTTIWSPHKDVTIGDKVQFGYDCRVQCDLELGNSILIASGVSFVGKDDHLTNIPGVTIWNSGRGDTHKTIVGNDVWIGHGAIILAGITIGDGAVVSAGSIVVKDVDPCTIVGGNPAHFIKNRFNTEQEKVKHLQFLKELYIINNYV